MLMGRNFAAAFASSDTPDIDLEEANAWARWQHGVMSVIRTEFEELFAYVDCDDEVFAERIGEPLERGVVGEGGGPDDDPRRARPEQSLGIGGRADASGRLHASRRRCQYGAAHDVGADLSTSRAVEVDEVDELRACVAVALDEGERIGTAVRDLAVVPLAQPNSVVA